MNNTLLSQYLGALGSGHWKIVVDAEQMALVAEELLGSTMSRKFLIRNEITVYNIPDDFDVKKSNMKDFMASGNGYYTWVAVKSAGDLTGFSRVNDTDKKIDWDARSPMIFKLVGLDVYLRFVQARSVVSIVSDSTEQVNWKSGTIPTYWRNYLGNEPNITGDLVHHYLGGAWVVKFPDTFLKEIRFGSLPSDIAARMLLSPGGFRSISMMRFLTEEDIKDDAPESHREVFRVLSKVQKEGYFWEWHPSFRPEAFHNLLGSFNNPFKDFLARVIKIEKLRALKDCKVLFDLPTADLRNETWKTWTKESFKWRNTPVDMERLITGPPGPPGDGNDDNDNGDRKSEEDSDLKKDDSTLSKQGDDDDNAGDDEPKDQEEENSGFKTPTSTVPPPKLTPIQVTLAGIQALKDTPEVWNALDQETRREYELAEQGFTGVGPSTSSSQQAPGLKTKESKKKKKTEIETSF